MAEAAARPRKRTNDPGGLRHRILDVAAAAFQAGGYHATGMHDILRGAGTTGGALHHHFATKKALGLAVIRERVAHEVEETWIAPVRAAPDGCAGVIGVFEAIVTALEQRGAVSGCPLNNLAIELSLADPDFRQAANEIFALWRDALAARFDADGPPRGFEAQEFATLVVAAYSGAMAMAKATQDVAPLKTCARQLATIMDRS